MSKTGEGSYPPESSSTGPQSRPARQRRSGRCDPVLTIIAGEPDGGEERAAAGGSSALIDEIVRTGARRMLAEALQAEVAEYIARFADQRDEAGRQLVVRNGSHSPREVTTCAGVVEVTAPRVND